MSSPPKKREGARVGNSQRPGVRARRGVKTSTAGHHFEVRASFASSASTHRFRTRAAPHLKPASRRWRASATPPHDAIPGAFTHDEWPVRRSASSRRRGRDP
jgi:hypothetical protein